MRLNPNIVFEKYFHLIYQNIKHKKQALTVNQQCISQAIQHIGAILFFCLFVTNGFTRTCDLQSQ